MGIVVTVFMYLILLLSIPSPLRTRLRQYQKDLALGALLAGLWNVGWYGAQHLGEFWGNAAMISGLLMIYTSLPLLAVSQSWPTSVRSVLLKAKAGHHHMPLFVNRVALLVLLGCAIIYSHTLILLNIS